MVKETTTVIKTKDKATVKKATVEKAPTIKIPTSKDNVNLHHDAKHYDNSLSSMYFSSITPMIVVLLGLVLVWQFLKKTNIRNKLNRLNKSTNSRMIIEDSIHIDRKNQVVILRQDDCEHLILVNEQQSLVIASNINKTKVK